MRLLHKDKNTKARVTKISTAHGDIETPVFMPVGTQGTVKTLTNQMLQEIGVGIILGNTYHLYIRPGTEIIAQAGGLHSFMNWKGAILTDSGGFQVFSLAKLRDIHEEGVEFRSHLDGSKHFFTPEKVVDIQLLLGSDIIMPLDECPPYPSNEDHIRESVRRTSNWALRSRKQFYRSEPTRRTSALFGIIQGGSFFHLRKESLERTVEIGFDGYAIGGVSVGESREIIHETAEYTASLMLEEKPRYIMGIGRPDDIVRCVSYGIDMFDCVMPTRNARNGQAFTKNGEINLRNSIHKKDFNPIDSRCTCYTCRTHSRAYLRHLFNTSEITGLSLVSLHNVHFYVTLMVEIRSAIREGLFARFAKSFLSLYQSGVSR